MLAVGAAILLGGYTLLFWGNRIRTGGGVSLADVVIPGHYQTGPLPDVPAAGGTPAPFGPPVGTGHGGPRTQPVPTVPAPGGTLPTYPAPRFP